MTALEMYDLLSQGRNNIPLKGLDEKLDIVLCNEYKNAIRQLTFFRNKIGVSQNTSLKYGH